MAEAPKAPREQDAPDWRWQRAVHERRKEQEGCRDYTISGDGGVRAAKRFLSLWEHPAFQGDACRELMPEITFLYDLYHERSPGCTKHALEAALVAGAGARFIQTKIHAGLTQFLVKMYSMIFYDVEGRLASPFWVERHIFMPAMAEKKGPLRNSAFFWKVIGYAGGPERLLRDCIEGHAYDDKDFEWIMNHVVGANARKALKYVHESDNLPKELTIPVVQKTIGGWEDRRNKFEELAGTGSGKTDVPDKHITFSGRLKMMAANDELPGIERPGADILKYKDEDLKEYQ